MVSGAFLQALEPPRPEVKAFLMSQLQLRRRWAADALAGYRDDIAAEPATQALSPFAPERRAGVEGGV